MQMLQKRFFLILLSGLLSCSCVFAQHFAQNPAWPLCGRIADNPPAGWTATDGCPAERWGSPTQTDLPIASPFGPRPLASENDRYDFHRGIDIATGVGTPVFAIADGIIKIAGEHASYSDPLVQVRHYRPGYSSCQDVGCYHSNYMHLSSVVVNVDDVVNKGDLIGYTGISASGFAHLHFEIRDAPAFDPFSRWQRDAIHPLEVLPYQSTAPIAITFDTVDLSSPDAPVVQVTVQTMRVDVKRVELELYDSNQNVVPQLGNVSDANGYNVYPAWFDMNAWNFQYTHKNSTDFPWESFGLGGANECPYYAEHGATYDAYLHLDAQDPADFHLGRFNGVIVQPDKYVAGNYSLSLTFEQLQGPADCMVANVLTTTGEIATAQWGNCQGSLAPQADAQSITTNEDVPIALTLTGTVGSGAQATFDIVRLPVYGVVSGTAPTVTYAPDANYYGLDSFDFVLHDGLTTSNVATVSINVSSVNDPPSANDQYVTTLKDTPVTVTLDGYDADGDSLSVSVVSGPFNGMLTGGGAERIYTPSAGYTGTDTFTVEMSDGNGGNDRATVFITVKKGKGGKNQDDGSPGEPTKGKK